ncbi:MAG: serine/threonine-protein kinase [Planctomycetaceae bacterium]
MNSPHSAQDEQLAMLLESLVARQAAGERIDIEREAANHPPLAAELRSLWATMQFASDIIRVPELSDEVSNGPDHQVRSRSPLDHSQGSDPVDQSRRDPKNGSPRLTTMSLPRMFGGYELLEEIGRGGMGVVYKAKQLSLGRIVALKLLLWGDLSTAEDLERFRVESRAAAQLTHDHAVGVYEVGDVEGQPFFSMQWIDGRTLSQRLAEGPLHPREAAELLVPVCRAVAAAHAIGVLHRDLKPANILLDAKGKPFVTDFGLAKRFDIGGRPADEPIAVRQASLTQTGAVVGTPGYMAPEQAAGKRGEVSPRTDVYALGAILYALLTGRAPFQGATPLETVLMVLEQDPPPLRVLCPNIDADLEMIVLKSLQKPADLRYASALALADDLETYLLGEPVAARSSHFSQVLSRAFRPTHHIAVLENWGVLWMWHAAVLLALCLVTNWLQLRGESSRWVYVLLWIVGLGTWAGFFWELRRRAGPVTFVERQIAHIWAASMACSSGLFLVEGLLGLPPLTLSPVLALIAAGVFVTKAGILSGEFYIPAAVLFLASVPMALWPAGGISLFGVVTALTFFLPGLKFHRLRRRQSSSTK